MLPAGLLWLWANRDVEALSNLYNSLSEVTQTPEGQSPHHERTTRHSSRSGQDLLSWLAAAGLISASVRAGFQKDVVPGELDAVAAHATALREWFRSFVQKHKGHPLRQDALKEIEPLNRVLARDEAFGQIIALDRGHRRARSQFTWRFERRWRSPDTLLIPIATAMADLICGEDFTQVKACERSPCTLLFVDRTRGHA